MREEQEQLRKLFRTSVPRRTHLLKVITIIAVLLSVAFGYSAVSAEIQLRALTEKCFPAHPQNRD